jgi:glycosyltransferase involved in cell wall biosynthesis
MVSIVLPCRNEARYIARCLDTLLATSYPQDRLEVLVMDGRSEDKTREIVERYARRFSFIRLLDNPRMIVPTALNLGIQAARGEVVVRVDAHALYPPEYIPRLVEGLLTSGADNVGGPVLVLPARRTAMARAIALGLSHPFGVGNSWFRIGTSEPRWVDTVAYGCWRRELFNRMGLFDEELVRDQDEEFNYRTIGKGGRVLLLPEAVSYYYARPTPRLAGRMLYQYGYFKPLVAWKVGRVATLRQLAPPLFVVALVLGLALAPFSAPARMLWSAMLLSYGAALLTAAAAAARAHGGRVALALLAVFPVLHLSYGAGYVQGMWRNLIGRGLRWRDPAAVPLSR